MAKAQEQAKICKTTLNETPSSSETAASDTDVTTEPEVIPTFSDYDDFEPFIEHANEDAPIHLHAQEWVDTLSSDDVDFATSPPDCNKNAS